MHRLKKPPTSEIGFGRSQGQFQGQFLQWLIAPATSCDRLNQRTFPDEAMIAFTFSGAKNSAGEIVPA
jgi:hypothetical protein